MRHVSLTCKNHPDLRWSCKEIAVKENPQPGEPAAYNGSRGIFFAGKTTGQLYPDKSGVQCTPDAECSCPASDLIIAPEDIHILRK